MSNYMKKFIWNNLRVLLFGTERIKKVCKLVKTLYILKQVPKQWHEKLYNAITNGFKINKREKCVYVKDTVDDYVILYLYVDDILIVSSKNQMIKSTKDIKFKVLT